MKCPKYVQWKTCPLQKCCEIFGVGLQNNSKHTLDPSDIHYRHMAAAGHAPAEKPKTPIRLEAVTSKTKTTRLAAALGDFDILNVAIQCNMYIILYVSVIFSAFISTTLLILGTRSWRLRFLPWKSHLRFIRFIDTRRMLTPAPELSDVGCLSMRGWAINAVIQVA